MALCQGPGTDNPSLASLGVGPGLAGRPHVKTLRIEDERVSSLRSDIHTWSSLCTSLWKIYQRGANRNLLVKAYRSHKISNRPQILAPMKVRMIVYCGKFLDQSLRHHAARVQAMKLVIEKRLHAKDKHSQKKVQRYQANFHVLLSRTLLLPLLVNDLIHMRHGYQSGCVLLQQIKAVFFKLHLHAAQMWWHCMWLGASQWERHALLHHICGSVGKASGIIAGASHNGEVQVKAWCFRCRFRSDSVGSVGSQAFLSLLIFWFEPFCVPPWLAMDNHRRWGLVTIGG